VDAQMDLPRLASLTKYQELFPPVHVSAALIATALGARRADRPGAEYAARSIPWEESAGAILDSLMADAPGGPP
jgi:hypothetical protein